MKYKLLFCCFTVIKKYSTDQLELIKRIRLSANNTQSQVIHLVVMGHRFCHNNLKLSLLILKNQIFKWYGISLLFYYYLLNFWNAFFFNTNNVIKTTLKTWNTNNFLFTVYVHDSLIVLLVQYFSQNLKWNKEYLNAFLKKLK
jgi:hypothetical protein